MQGETVALCALNKIYGYHPAIAMEMITEAGGLASALFDGKPRNPHGHPELVEQLTAESLDWAEKELERVAAEGFRFIPYGDDEYPEPLAGTEDPPLGIYVNGSTSPAEIFSLRPMVAIVGTRDISPYGSLCCKRIVKALAEAAVKPCIVSGLAFGADGIAHRTALDLGLTTIGVMATGIDKIYPWQHAGLAGDMVKTPGCALVTDYTMGTSPVALNFVRRNRIIAGLASAVIVIESKKKGGSLMTAKYAFDYSRDVYAIPGRLDDERSRGCNSLVATHMADIISSIEDLPERLGLSPRTANSLNRRSAYYGRLAGKFGPTSPHVAVGMAVFDNPGISFQDLPGIAGLPYVTVLECAGILEAQGMISTDILQRCTING